MDCPSSESCSHHLCPLSNETVCKVARSHNSCIYSVASHSWCQITPFTQSRIISSGIVAPKIQMWPPRWPPQTAAARNAPVDGQLDELLASLAARCRVCCSHFNGFLI